MSEQKWRIVWTEDEKSIKVDGVEISETVESVDIQMTPFNITLSLRIDNATEIVLETKGEATTYRS